MSRRLVLHSLGDKAGEPAGLERDGFPGRHSVSSIEDVLVDVSYFLERSRQ